MDGPLSSDKPDLFEKRPSSENLPTKASVSVVQSPELDQLPDDFDELPIELISLADRWAQSSFGGRASTC